MRPFIYIGKIKIPLYGTFAIFGLLAFIVCAVFFVEKKEKADEKNTNGVLLICAAGAAISYVCAYFFNSLFHSIANKKLTLGGITWLGGILGALPAMLLLLLARKNKTAEESMLQFNLLMPGIALGHAFGRVGCFFAGCCYGAVTDSALGVRFPAGSSAARRFPEIADGRVTGSLPVLPTQLFEAAFEFALFCALCVLYKKHKRILAETYAFAYGAFRFILEFFRADNRGATGFFLSPSQVMSIVLIVYGVLLLLYRRGVIFKKKTTTQTADKTSENGESASENLENACKNFEEKIEID